MDGLGTLIRLIENLLIVGFVAKIGLVLGNVILRYGFVRKETVAKFGGGVFLEVTIKAA